MLSRRCLNNESEYITLYPNRDREAYFYDHKRPVIEIIKENSITHDRLPNVRFQVEMGLRKEPGMQGEDTVSFLFSANKNGALQNISSVASGGEIARVMLSVKAMIAGAVKLPTIVFDEIDTGVSGEIADRMADIMQEMGEQERQVISITHLPQIAARGRAHYKVYKRDNDMETNSHIRRLTDEERVEEIAHMLSGATLTEAALENAKSLLNSKLELSNSK